MSGPTVADYICVSSGSTEHGDAASGVSLARMLSPHFWGWGDTGLSWNCDDSTSILGRREIANLVAAVKTQWCEMDSLRASLRKRQSRKNAPRWLKGMKL